MDRLSDEAKRIVARLVFGDDAPGMREANTLATEYERLAKKIGMNDEAKRIVELEVVETMLHTQSSCDIPGA